MTDCAPFVTLEVAIDKRKIPAMPRARFDGRIVVVQTKAEMSKAVSYLRRQPVLGLDTETRPSFSKRTSYKVSLLQVSAGDICFLFRLNYIGLPQELVSLLGSDDNLKIGLSFKDDVRMLHQRAEFKMGRMVELQKLASEFGVTDKSLQKLYANLFHQRISKSQRLSNWEADVLSDAQKQYAALDAWACVRIYDEFLRLRHSHNYTLTSEKMQMDMVDKVTKDLADLSGDMQKEI